jgi:radical SAM superfamily enzyme YgiQ (UPF0313 family)
MLIVNPNNRLNSPFSAVEPPLWASLIASYNNADILDAEALSLNPQETEQAIRNSGHKDVLIVVMGNNPSVSSTPKMPVAESLADSIRDLNVSLTGLHPIAAGSIYPVVKTPFKGYPKVQWDKLPMHLYRAHNWHCLDGSPREPYASIYTSLGCPYSCYYCNIHTLYGERKIHFRQIDDILRDIDYLITRYRVKNIKIWDELFAINEGRVLQICNCLKYYDLNIWAYARLDTVTEKMLKAMKRGGINWLAYGFESVTDKKFVDRTEDIIKMTRDAGINIMANFIFGLPGNTLDDDEASLEFAMKHLFEYVNFYDAKPYPGSQWHKDVKLSVPCEAYDQYKNISEFRQKAFETYFNNPDYLAMVFRKWGSKSLENIRSMMNWKLIPTR